MNTYTTTLKVREESGFSDNVYITDASVDAQRTRAYGLINSYLGARYKIPTLTDTNFIDSPASQLLESVENSLASALLLIREYGTSAVDTDKDGFRRKEDVMLILTDIRDGKLSLFGNDGNLLE